jgi:hypothetical protein
MTERFVLLVVVVAAAWLVVRWWERRTPRQRGRLEPGVTLVTADWCRLCGAAMAALERHGVQPRRVSVGQLRGVDVRALPTLLVVDSRGRLVMRRSGRSVIESAGQVAEYLSKVPG